MQLLQHNLPRCPFCSTHHSIDLIVLDKHWSIAYCFRAKHWEAHQNLNPGSAPRQLSVFGQVIISVPRFLHTWTRGNDNTSQSCYEDWKRYYVKYTSCWWGFHSFFFIAEWWSIIFIHSSIGRQVGCFQFGAIINKVTMNIFCANLFVNIHFHFS